MTASKKTVVLNLRDLPKTVKDGVYIGRGTKWGNPFVITKECTREQAVAKYRAALWKNKQLLGEVVELRGKSLLCFCAPQACHGHVLVAALAWLDSQPMPKPAQRLTEEQIDDAVEHERAVLTHQIEDRPAPEPTVYLDDPKLIPSRWKTTEAEAKARKAGGMGNEFALKRNGEGIAEEFPF
jgi:Domain of unknown function (DUF4326)